MKKYDHPIDDLFREALKDHEMVPSEAAKKAFLRDITQSPPSTGKSGRVGWVILSLLLVLVGAGIWIWATSSDKSTSIPGRKSNPAATNSPAAIQNPVKYHNEVSDLPAKQIKTGSTTLSQNQQQQQQKHLASSSPSARPDLPVEHHNPAAVQEVASSPILPAAATNPAGSSAPEYSKQPAGDTQEAIASSFLPPVVPVNPDTGSNNMLKTSDSVMVPVPGETAKIRETSPKNSIWIPSIGVSYTPEWMFNTLEGTKFVNNFGIDGTFYHGQFSIRLGVGISSGTGTNELIVGYNEFLGAYNKLDSIDFTWSDPAHNYVPTMYMSKQDVWDSLMKLEYPKVVKRYTYLEVPLIMGYDLWESGRFTIGVRVGPVMSVLLYSKLLSAPYDPGNNRIVSVNAIAPGQVNLNWQVMGGINMACRLTDRLNFEIEPCARYYFNSVYEKPANDTKPWSVGVRAAFVVKFK